MNDISEYYRHNFNGLMIDTMFARSNFKNMIVSYEDTSLSYVSEFAADTTKVVVLRDIKNLVASRLKRMRSDPGSQATQRLMRIDEQLVNLWAEHAKAVIEEQVIGIVLEDWSDSKEYRDGISRRLGVKNIDNTSTVLPFGGGSSFTGITSRPPSTDELRCRYLQVQPDESVSKLLERNDIVALRACLGFTDGD
jgi:hypothetical protein